MNAPATYYPQSLPPGAQGGVGMAYPASVAMPDAMNQDLALQLQLRQKRDQLEAQQRRHSMAEVGRGFASSAVELGASVVGGSTIGKGATTLFYAVNGNHEKQKQLEDLLVTYKPQISQELGIPYDQVTLDHLHWYAERPGKEQIADTITKIHHGVARKVTNGVAGLAGGGLATAGATLLLGAGSALAWPVAVPVAIVGSMVASTISDKAATKITGIDVNDSAFEALNQVQGKLAQRQPLSAMDVLFVLKAGDKQLQGALDSQAGSKGFDKLPTEHQEAILTQYHGNLVEACHQLAYQISTGATQPGTLLTINTLALSQGGAQAAYQLTQNDIMRDMGENLLETPQRATPSNQIATQGAEVSPMQSQLQQGAGVPSMPVIGEHTGRLAQQSQIAAMQGAQQSI